ncbi:MAG: serine/threonine-protein kinase [Pirellulales bacterium]
MGLFSQFSKLLSGGRVDVFARYELMRQAVSGSMSEFHVARDRETGQLVGLKILDAEKTAHFESRFKGLKKPSEGEIAKALSHPNIVQTYEYGQTSDGRQYIVMELVDGPGLNSLIIGRSPQLDGKRLPLLRQAAEAIGAVHAAGYIHRDICPRNLIVDKDCQTLKLIDFGLTVPMKGEFLQPGNRTGTPNYMAPEIVRRKKTDQRVDIFALGVTAYALCTYELPWSGGTTGKAAMSHDTQEPVDIRQRRPQLNTRLAQAIMKCLEPLPENRPPDTETFLKMIAGVTREDQK